VATEMAAVTALDERGRLAEANARLGTIFFLVTEGVFFVGMVFAALVIRNRFASWPSADTPPLNPGWLVANALVLLASGATAWAAERALRAGHPRRALALLTATLGLGALFLAGQLAEFTRLGGWQPRDSMFRTLFDTLAGLHGLHVGMGLALLALVWVFARRGVFSPDRHALFTAGAWYWVFVAVTWPVLLAVLTLPS
jgi:cytochrome c oxidase subunit III